MHQPPDDQPAMIDTAPGSRENLRAIKRWYLVFVMFFIAVTAQIDRQIMAMLAPQMKVDLHLSDEQIGVLLGFGFSLTYAFFAIFMAYLGDRFSRKKVLAGGLMLWSLLTALCAMAGSFPAMLAARLGVGIGESVLTPTTQPMVSSAFPTEKRAMPISMVVAGSPVGLVVAPILVGIIVHVMQGRTLSFGAILPVVHGWQLAFIACGLLGLVALILLLPLREPRNRLGGRELAATVPEAVGYFLRHKRYFGGIFISMPILAISDYALIAWMPSYLARTFHLDARAIGLLSGSSFIPAAVVAPFIAAALGRYAARSPHHRIYFRIMLGLMPITGLLIALPMLMPTPLSATIAFAFPVSATMVVIAFSMINIQQVVAPRYRSQASAVAQASFMLIGSGFGPTVAGVVATRIVGEGSLGLALLVCLAAFVPLSAIVCFLALKDPRANPIDPDH
jgi:MFS family permease